MLLPGGGRLAELGMEFGTGVGVRVLSSMGMGLGLGFRFDFDPFGWVGVEIGVVIGVEVWET